VEDGAAIAAEVEDPVVRADAWNLLGMLAFEGGDLAAAHAWHSQAVALLRGMDDPWRLALALADLAVVLEGLDPRHVTALYEESLTLWRAQGDDWGLTVTTIMFGDLLTQQGRFAEVGPLFDEALARTRAARNWADVAWLLRRQAQLAQRAGAFDQAATLLHESLAITRELGNAALEARTLTRLGMLAQSQRDPAGAAAYYEESLTASRAAGDRTSVANNLVTLGVLLNLRGERRRAATLVTEGLRLSHALGSVPLVLGCIDGLAAVAASGGNADRSARLFGATDALRARLDTPLPPEYRGLHQRTLTAVRTALGDDHFAAVWAEGRTLSLDAAVALALEETAESGGGP
jgi:tetratricopeptide (TPR) repeat protein